MNNDLISRKALKKDFKERLEKAKNWKEDALIRGDNEIEIRADATINFICEVLMTINSAPTVLHDNYSMGYQDGVKKVLSERPQGEWIPVSERLPDIKINPITKDFEFVLCTTVWGDVRPYRFGKPIHMKEAHFWNGCGVMDDYVIAWMPLPELYKEEAENETN